MEYPIFYIHVEPYRWETGVYISQLLPGGKVTQPNQDLPGGTIGYPAQPGLTWRKGRLLSPTRINLEEPVRVASPTRINLEEPARVAQHNQDTLASRGLEEPAHASRGLEEPFFQLCCGVIFCSGGK
jgi:hypothetical protein